MRCFWASTWTWRESEGVKTSNALTSMNNKCERSRWTGVTNSIFFLSIAHTHILFYTHHFHLSASFTLYFTDRKITQIGRSVESCRRVGSNIKKWATPTAPDCLHTRTVHNSLQAEPSIARQHPTDLLSALWRKHPLFLRLSIHRSVFRCLEFCC